jgi:hypothetical protein
MTIILYYMKTNLLLKLILLTGIFFASFIPAKSQLLQVTSEITPEEMVEMLIGSGLDYDNVVFAGADASRGSFWGGPGNIGLGNGIILTSGNVNLAPGPNNSSSAGASNDTPGDNDLQSLAGVNTFDACVLEFDFVPFYEHVWFDFVFGSEEYPEYINQFNDVFGFFISGPGITGPFSNNSKNIALIPGTDIPVSINNVNEENNSAYYVVNDSNFIQYDGFTTVFTAESAVMPMQTYHIKLAIGDGVDHVFDSGVLLQASSFCSGPVTSIGSINQQGTGENYQVYPIPAGNVLNIVSNDGQIFYIQLIGQDGRTYISGSGESQITLDISTVPFGIYFLRITDKDGIATRKIFKN